MAEYRPNYMMPGRGYPDSRPDGRMNYRQTVPAQRPGCGRREPEPEPVCEPEKPVVKVKADQYELAMAYVPWQHWRETYDLDKALAAGTIFPELDKPFYYAGGGCR